MMRFKYLILIGFLGCDDAADASGDDADDGVGGACVQSDLVAQCPLASSPIVGAQAEASCTSAVGGVVEDAEGQATAQCYGVGGCRVMCQFQVPCRCGVASVSRDGVLCASCEDAASCGNGVCEGGEDPTNCPIDCGSVCMAGERRCDGAVIEECSLQGRFERVPCPEGEVCDSAEGSVRCIRDPNVIVGGDAGVGDGGPPPEDGRLYLGDGVWPEVADVRTAPMAAAGERTLELGLETGRVPNGPSRFAGVMAQAGSERIFHWRLRSDGLLEGLGPTAAVRLRPDGSLVERAADELPPIEVEGYCERAQRCEPELTDEACRNFWETLQNGGEWRLRCLAATYDATGNCSTLFAQDQACTGFYIHPHPAGFVAQRPAGPLVGDRLLGTSPAQDGLVVLDLATRALLTQNPVPGYALSDRRALSADGRVAAAVATQGTDEVILLWHVDTPERRAILAISVGSYARVALSPDGRVLATYLSGTGDPRLDGGVSLWNTETEQRIVTIRPLPQSAIGTQILSFSPGGDLLAADMGAEIEVWRVGQVPEEHQSLSIDGQVRPKRGAFGPDGATFVADFGGLTLWDASTGQRRRTVALDGGEEIQGWEFTPDGQRLVVLIQYISRAYRFLVFE